MLDTNICIYAINRRPAHLHTRFNAAADSLCISSVTLSELMFGAENSSRRDDNLRVVNEFAARIEVLVYGAKAAQHYGQLRAALTGAGQTAGALDMLIGAHARSEGLTLVTNNLREFSRMPGLQVENWV